MAVIVELMECEGCGESTPTAFLDLEPGLFGDKALCPVCNRVCAFEIVVNARHDDD